MWGFKIRARVSEYTEPEPGATDHCVKTDDLMFTIEMDGHTANVAGSIFETLALHRSTEGLSKIMECRVRTATTK